MKASPPVAVTLVVATVLTACGLEGNGAATSTFPQHGGFGSGGPAGATSGTVVMRDGCLMYAEAGGFGPSLLIWPADYAPVVTDARSGVTGDDRLIVEGDSVVLGGGEYTDEAWVFDHLVGPPITDACRTGRYVLVTSVLESPNH